VRRCTGGGLYLANTASKPKGRSVNSQTRDLSSRTDDYDGRGLQVLLLEVSSGEKETSITVSQTALVQVPVRVLEELVLERSAQCDTACPNGMK